MVNYTSGDCYQLIKELFGLEEDKPLPPTYIRQIDRFILQYDVSYLELSRILYYCYDQKNCKFDKQYGISLNFGLYKDEALAYFKKLEKEKEERKKDAEKITFEGNNIIFNIKPIQNNRARIKQINIGEIEVEDK